MTTAEVILEAVRNVLRERISATEMVRRIRRLVAPPTDPKPVETDDRGWPKLPPGSGVIELPEGDAP